MDSLPFDWYSENCLLVPPVYLIPQVIMHFITCRLFFVFVVDCSHVQDGSDVFVQGSSKEICSGSPSSALQCCFWGLMLLELRWSSSLVCVRSVAYSGPGPVALLRQRLYCTSEAPSESIARILQPYNIRVAHKPITTLRRLLILLMSRTKTNRKTDGEQYARSNAATARLLPLVKPAET